jgi:hypothetical protein
MTTELDIGYTSSILRLEEFYKFSAISAKAILK